MSNKYYYLVASLPYLAFGGDAPVSRDAFVAECEKWLTPEDMKKIRSADIRKADIDEDETGVLREWQETDRALLEELARLRTGKKEKAAVKTPEALKGIMERETPLEMETEFERKRWNFLEEKSTAYMFDLNWLLIYFLKLQILERLASFDKDKGEGFFYKLCEVVYE